METKVYKRSVKLKPIEALRFQQAHDRMAKEGMTLREIAAEMGINHTTMLFVLGRKTGNEKTINAIKKYLGFETTETTHT